MLYFIIVWFLVQKRNFEIRALLKIRNTGIYRPPISWTRLNQFGRSKLGSCVKYTVLTKERTVLKLVVFGIFENSSPFSFNNLMLFIRAVYFHWWTFTFVYLTFRAVYFIALSISKAQKYPLKAPQSTFSRKWLSTNHFLLIQILQSILPIGWIGLDVTLRSKDLAILVSGSSVLREPRVWKLNWCPRCQWWSGRHLGRGFDIIYSPVES